MKIVKQEKLFYIQASSHKVYEVDLCEVGYDEYIVNIRYGEKGGIMREGTKTVFPVSYEKALNTFQELVDAKIQKNYQSENTPNPSISFGSTKSTTQEEKNNNIFSSIFSSLTKQTAKNQEVKISFKKDSKKESILFRLEEAVKGNHIDKKWKLSRVIWKAGELKIIEAVPFIVKLAQKKNDPLYQYCVAWSLGKLKQGGDSIAVLMDYYQNGDDKVKRMAGEALLEILPTEEINTAIDSILVSLPQILIHAIQTNEIEEISKAIRALLQKEYKDKVPDFLYTLYLVSKTKVAVRWALLAFFKEVLIDRNFFKPIRHIFKMAEFREDSQVYALIAAQIYKQEAKFHANQHNRREIQHSAAFSQYTKEYFHRRILRTLTHIAEHEKTQYVEMATEILLAYNGSTKAFSTNQLALYYILYGGGENWILERNLTEYYWCDTVPQHNLSFSLRQDRLDVHQEIWNDNQEAIENLLRKSTVKPVLEFASKVFFNNQTWFENVKISFVIELLSKNVGVATMLLAIDIAKKIYDENQPQTELINALLQTPYGPAQELAFEWIQVNPTKILGNWEIVHFLLIATSSKIQEWVAQNIPLYSKLISQEALEKALAKTLFLLCDLQELEKIAKSHWNNANNKTINEQYLTPIIDNLWHCFSEKLIGLSIEAIVQLLKNPLERVQYLGAKIVVNHKTLAQDIPNELLISLLTSHFASVRKEVMLLISKFDVSTLSKYQTVLWNQSFDGTDDVKNYLKGIHQYISSQDATYSQKLATFILTEAPFTKDVTYYLEDKILQEEFKKFALSNFERWVMCNIEHIQCVIFDVLVQHQDVPQQLPQTYLQTALVSSFATVRNKGLQLLSVFPLEELLKQKEVIISFCSADEPSIQEGIAKILQKMLQNEEFVIYAIDELSKHLLRKEPYEGLHEHIFKLIERHFANHLHFLSDKRMWKLIHTNHKVGNQLGAILLRKQDLSKTTIKTLVNLGSHEAVIIRQIVWEYFEKDVPRIRYEAEQAIRLLSATWDDSKEFAFNYFEKNFEKEHWTPELLISICDNVQADIQQYGRKLITRFFEEKSGELYLLHLSQHPSKEVQLMVTNYVERFASEHLQNIQKLLPYFATVLMGINKGRVAKQRIFEFLHQQSLKSEEVSKMILPTLVELSLTVSIENKAKIIQILRDIQVNFPHLENPIKVKEVITI